MRKNELIKILQQLKGNPEIVLWNGFVEDFQQISKDIVKVGLYKLTFEGYKERVNLHRQVRENLPILPNEYLADSYKNNNIGCWELFNYYPPTGSGYLSKSVYIMGAKVKGKVSFDRAGSISY